MLVLWLQNQDFHVHISLGCGGELNKAQVCCEWKLAYILKGYNRILQQVLFFSILLFLFLHATVKHHCNTVVLRYELFTCWFLIKHAKFFLEKIHTAFFEGSFVTLKFVLS